MSRNACEVPDTKPKPLIVRERFAAAGANATAQEYNPVICRFLKELPEQTRLRPCRLFDSLRALRLAQDPRRLPGAWCQVPNCRLQDYTSSKIDYCRRQRLRVHCDSNIGQRIHCSCGITQLPDGKGNRAHRVIEQAGRVWSVPPLGFVKSTWWVSVLIPTPERSWKSTRLPITCGGLPPSPAMGARPRSTRFMVPAPPGVMTAQFNRGSIPIAGLTPVLYGVRVPPICATKTGTPVEVSRTVARLVTVHLGTTTARCVRGLIPIAIDTGPATGGGGAPI